MEPMRRGGPPITDKGLGSLDGVRLAKLGKWPILPVGHQLAPDDAFDFPATLERRGQNLVVLKFAFKAFDLDIFLGDGTKGIGCLLFGRRLLGLASLFRVNASFGLLLDLPRLVACFGNADSMRRTRPVPTLSLSKPISSPSRLSRVRIS